MNAGQSLVTHSQAAELMQPSDRALDNPASLTQTAAMRGTTLGQLGTDAVGMQPITVGLGVVAAITLNALGLVLRPARLTGERWNRLHQGFQLSDVVPVGLSEDDAQRNALRLDQEVVLATRLTAIGWVRSSFFPPCTARTEELSATTREKSTFSAPRSLESNTRCRRSHTPAFCHAWSRRQQVIPEPQPISFGSISQGIPEMSTNKTPLSTLRLSNGFRPGCRRRRRLGAGSSGSITDHSSSSTKSRAILPRKDNELRAIVPVTHSFC